MASGSAPPPIADLSAFERQKEQKAWYFYDWANSAYVTTIATVLFAPYLIAVAETAACGEAGTDDNPCNVDLSVLGRQRLPRLAGLLRRHAGHGPVGLHPAGRRRDRRPVGRARRT